MELSASQAFANFRAWVPRNALTVGSSHPQSWTYYDWGPRSYREPLLCLHSLVGSSESFYHQVISLAPRGYRVLSVQIPVYWSIDDFCEAFHSFLNILALSRIHIYAAGLGAFLALQYIARKPDRVVSMALTHSFLSSETIKRQIPYPPSVLRWLPDFLVRSTMKSILPKGRASRNQAAAAEFAIGHTMPAPRDILASRLALFVSSSSVVPRISESRVTLIDALDRAPISLELSKNVSKQLPGARRAFLKEGGDFPYLSVPDEVNVHLVVHLRRHAPNPDSPLPLPPPARPHPLPPSVVQRKRDEAIRSQKEEADKSFAQSPQSKAKLSKEALLKEARALVSAEERSKIEKYGFEITRLREFLPNRDDRFLAAIVVDCDGNIDEALMNIRHKYSDDFYEKAHTHALQQMLKTLVDAEESGGPSPKRNGANDDQPASNTEISNESKHETTGQEISAEDISHSHDPLGGSNFIVNGGDKNVDHFNSEVVESTDDFYAPSSSEDESIQTKEGHGFEVSQISIERNYDCGNNSGFVDAASKNDQHGRSGRRRKTDSADTHGVSAYVTSERVGMRSSGSMVGRGPAPFKTALTSEDSWSQSSPPVDLNHEALEVVPINDNDINEESGACLLESEENPLELPFEEHLSSRITDTGRSTWKDDPLLDGVGASDGRIDLDGDGRGGSEPWESFQHHEVETDNYEKERDEVDGHGLQQAVSGDHESEEDKRLRMWSMSALAAASKSVSR